MLPHITPILSPCSHAPAHHRHILPPPPADANPCMHAGALTHWHACRNQWGGGRALTRVGGVLGCVGDASHQGEGWVMTSQDTAQSWHQCCLRQVGTSDLECVPEAVPCSVHLAGGWRHVTKKNTCPVWSHTSQAIPALSIHPTRSTPCFCHYL